MTQTKPTGIGSHCCAIHALRTGSAASRRRLCQAVNAMLATKDGRFAGQAGFNLSELERFRDELSNRNPR